MILLPRSTAAARPAGRTVPWGLACALLCLFAVAWSAPAAPPLGAPADATAGQVDFPAAAAIRLDPVEIGPIDYAGPLGPFNPEDTVLLDFDNTEIDVINSQGSTGGTRTVVASSSVGTGPTFNIKVNLGVVSPQEQLYYWAGYPTNAFIKLDLTNSSYPRTQVNATSSTALLPYGVQGNAPILAWDFANNAIVYSDAGTSGTTAPNGSTIARGIYRFTPSTTAGVASTNVLLGTIPTSTPQVFCYGVTVKQDGTIYALLDVAARNAPQIVQVISPATFTRVDGGAAATPAYSAPNGISWDFVNQRILVFDEGQDQSTARILSIDPAAGARTYISNGSAGPAATYAGTYLDSVSSGFRNTANRILYIDVDLSGAPATARLSTVVPGSSTASQYYTGATASSTTGRFGGNAQDLAIIPPTLPAISSPTAANGTAGAETLGANVTSAGTALVTPAVQTRGVVYAPTGTNANPTVGGTGVTQVAATATTGVFTVSASGLAAGTSYSYAGYVSTYYGLVYTAVGTFTTPTLPTVTTPTATAVTGTGATLGGNVTADGGGTITARGVVYAPTATSSNPAIGGTGVINLTTTGTTGVFTVNATGLANGTPYSYRAYATNAAGTAYTTAATFTTAAPPTANSQSVTVPFNTAKAITLTGSDPNTPAQALTYTITAQPTHGTLSGIAPNVTYTPTANYQGADSFQFTTTNTGSLTSTAATVTITVGAGTPTATGQSGLVVLLNTPTAITLTGTDPDSPALALSYTVTANPANGTLSGTAPNLTYTPTTGYTGTDNFVFTANNGQRTSAAATVNLTVVGQPYVTTFTASGAVGSTVTITGNNFLGMTGVTFFRNIAATTFTVQTDTQMTVVVPAGAKTGVLTLTNGLGANTTSTKFTVTP